jgi:hypothetical protein
VTISPKMQEMIECAPVRERWCRRRHPSLEAWRSYVLGDERSLEE